MEYKLFDLEEFKLPELLKKNSSLIENDKLTYQYHSIITTIIIIKNFFCVGIMSFYLFTYFLLNLLG